MYGKAGTSQKNWEDAFATCKKDGAQLVVVDNEEIYNITQEMFPQQKYYIAGSDADSEGNWYWKYGNGDRKNVSFSKWRRYGTKSAEPNGGTEENSLVQTGTGWNDVGCDGAYPFVCQLPAKGNGCN